MSKLDQLASLANSTKDGLLKAAKSLGDDQDGPQQQENDGMDDLAKLCKSTSKRLLDAPVFKGRKKARGSHELGL